LTLCLELQVSSFETFKAAIEAREDKCRSLTVYMLLGDRLTVKFTREPVLGYVLMPCGLPDEIKFIK
jgi:hypothetical protein